VLVFFIGYVIFEIPSNIVIKKLGAANWLSFIAFAWGVVSIGIGFCNHWIVLAVCRALLGVLEAVSATSLPPMLCLILAGFLSRLRISRVFVVPSVRSAEKTRGILHACLCAVRVCQHPCIRHYSDRQSHHLQRVSRLCVFSLYLEI
jgi:MFS family permease